MKAKQHLTDKKINAPQLTGKKREYPLPIQKMFRWVGKAIDHYQMIADGDRIAVGVSGVDSLSLLWVLRERLAWIPITYTLQAFYIDLGFDEKMSGIFEGYLKKEAYDYRIIKTTIGVKAHEPPFQKNPCFFCSRERKKIFFAIARDSNISKIAFGHHIEDINATLFMNIFYGSSVSTMLPRQDLFGGKLTIIRPNALVDKEHIQTVAAYLNLPPVINPCPSSQTSQRKKINDLLNYFYAKDRRIRYNIFRAMQNIHRDYLPG